MTLNGDILSHSDGAYDYDSGGHKQVPGRERGTKVKRRKGDCAAPSTLVSCQLVLLLKRPKGLNYNSIVLYDNISSSSGVTIIPASVSDIRSPKDPSFCA